MSDFVDTTTPRGARHKQSHRQKAREADIPTTPGRARTPKQAAATGHNASGYHSSSGRLQQNRHSYKGQDTHNYAPASIPPLDGAASPRPGSRPISIQPGGETPHRVTTPARQAYAGPTFHASPAPSSLPMPKFFSKSLPANDIPLAAVERAQSNDAPVKDMPPSPLPTPAATPSSFRPPVHREASPLDVLFNAHRAEQARHKVGEGTVHDARNSLLQAQARHSEPTTRADGTTSAGPSRRALTGRQPMPRNDAQQLSGKEIFMMEVDGADNHREQQAHTPLSFEDRIRAVQGQSGNSTAGKTATMDDEQRLAKTMALKQFLSGQNEGSRVAGFETSRSRENQPTVTPGAESAGPDIRTMEANLKKLLNLNP